MKILVIAFIAAAFTLKPIISESCHYTHLSIVVPFDLNDRNKKEVELTDLPADISYVLNSEEYRGWEPVSAWQSKTERGSEYLVELRKGEITRKLKIGEDGRALVSFAECL